MSSAEEQTNRELILSFLNQHGLPASGTIYVVRKGEEADFQTEPLDEVFFAESTVVLLLPRGGNWMDGQCYDQFGYQVYTD